MVVKIYISGISGNKEVKKKQQRVQMILDSKCINYEAIDITEPGREKDKETMQQRAKVREVLGKHPLPPQIFNEEDYCGDYEDFDMANEVDELEAFLHLPVPSKIISDDETEKLNGSREENGNPRNGAKTTEVNGDVELTSIEPETGPMIPEDEIVADEDVKESEEEPEETEKDDVRDASPEAEAPETAETRPVEEEAEEEVEVPSGDDALPDINQDAEISEREDASGGARVESEKGVVPELCANICDVELEATFVQVQDTTASTQVNLKSTENYLERSKVEEAAHSEVVTSDSRIQPDIEGNSEQVVKSLRDEKEGTIDLTKTLIEKDREIKQIDEVVKVESKDTSTSVTPVDLASVEVPLAVESAVSVSQKEPLKESNSSIYRRDPAVFEASLTNSTDEPIVQESNFAPNKPLPLICEKVPKIHEKDSESEIDSLEQEKEKIKNIEEINLAVQDDEKVQSIFAVSKKEVAETSVLAKTPTNQTFDLRQSAVQVVEEKPVSNAAAQPPESLEKVDRKPEESHLREAIERSQEATLISESIVSYPSKTDADRPQPTISEDQCKPIHPQEIIAEIPKVEEFAAKLEKPATIIDQETSETISSSFNRDIICSIKSSATKSSDLDDTGSTLNQLHISHSESVKPEEIRENIRQDRGITEKLENRPRPIDKESTPLKISDQVSFTKITTPDPDRSDFLLHSNIDRDKKPSGDQLGVAQVSVVHEPDTILATEKLANHPVEPNTIPTKTAETNIESTVDTLPSKAVIVASYSSPQTTISTTQNILPPESQVAAIKVEKPPQLIETTVPLKKSETDMETITETTSAKTYSEEMEETDVLKPLERRDTLKHIKRPSLPLTKSTHDPQPAETHPEGVPFTDLLLENHLESEVDKISFSPQLVSKIVSDRNLPKEERGLVLKSWNYKPTEVDFVKQVRGLLDDRDNELICYRARLRAGYYGRMRDPHEHFLSEMKKLVHEYDADEDEIYEVVPPPPPKVPTPPPEPPVYDFIQEVLNALNAPWHPKPKPEEPKTFVKQVKDLLNTEELTGDAQALYFTKERGPLDEDDTMVHKVRIILDEKESAMGIKKHETPTLEHVPFLSDVLVLLNDEPVTDKEGVEPVAEIVGKPREPVQPKMEKKPVVEPEKKAKEIKIAEIFVRDNVFPILARVTSDNFKIVVSALNSQRVELTNEDLDAVTITVVEDNGYKSDVAKIVVSPTKF